MPLTAAAAETIITPPLGFRLQGYFSAGPATAVHDDLHARALVVDDGTTRVAIVSCDLIAVDRRLSGPIREMVRDAIGIDHVMVCATHTHAGHRRRR
jgi:predicted neutral ceramidase superfamily lipid hydrolase